MAPIDDPTAGSRARWVVRYLGEGEPPPADVALIQRSVQVLDATARMLLVGATPDQLALLVRALPHWAAERERSFTLVP